MTEQLTDTEHVEHAVAEHDFDGSRPDDAQMLNRLDTLREDRRAGEEELDLGGGRDPLHVGYRERVERRMRAQEVDHIGERRWRSRQLRVTWFVGHWRDRTRRRRWATRVSWRSWPLVTSRHDPARTVESSHR